MRSHLIPTPRTDKNGRTVIRHVKGDSFKSPVSSLPPVSPPAAQPQRHPDFDILNDIYGDNRDSLPRNVENAVLFIQDKNPGLRETVSTLLARNSPSGTASLRAYLSESLSLISDQMSLSDEENLIQLSYTDGVNTEFNESVVRMWAIGSVRGEIDLHPTLHDNDFQDGLAGLMYLVYGDDVKKHPNRETDADYWRGVTAYYFLNEDYLETPEEQQEAQRFIEYAGKHEDIASVVTIARDRKTVNVDTINGIIEQGTDAPAIRDGIL